ncbi:hypothetical protein SAMN05660971_02216 [Halomonas cupida]|uniref:Uncharacterized protein n=1 Tax=Halomonas cupida TaxID=44933 RepID=A0A1M7G7W4_9GAMM|nr:hypothetical protein SAMN05660971_02216 [Halomonas cupida]
MAAQGRAAVGHRADARPCHTSRFAHLRQCGTDENQIDQDELFDCHVNNNRQKKTAPEDGQASHGLAAAGASRGWESSSVTPSGSDMAVAGVEQLLTNQIIEGAQGGGGTTAYGDHDLLVGNGGDITGGEDARDRGHATGIGDDLAALGQLHR